MLVLLLSNFVENLISKGDAVERLHRNAIHSYDTDTQRNVLNYDIFSSYSHMLAVSFIRQSQKHSRASVRPSALFSFIYHEYPHINVKYSFRTLHQERSGLSRV